LQPHASAALKDCLDPKASFIVSDILRDPMARARTFGTDSVLATRINAAVKTGTSKDMRDNWAIGYSSRFTVGVWVGNASGASMWDVSGTTGAAPVWAALVQYLHPRGDVQANAAIPAGVVQVATQYAKGQEASRSEWFIAGTEQAVIADDAALTATGRILQPAAGSIIALDPDIPPQRQRLQLLSDQANGQWRISGKPIGQGSKAQWMPWPGRHVIELVDARGNVLDEVRIEVRGAAFKKPERDLASAK
jgi:penicillin-binding protein 1C